LALTARTINHFFGTSYTIEQIEEMGETTALMMIAIATEWHSYQAFLSK
jgi:hypothetical protein